MDTNGVHVHNFTETIVPPTCKENGYSLYRCACGYERKSNFKPVGNHAFQRTKTTPSTCTDSGNVQLVCAVCGESQVDTIPPHGHEYGDWSVQVFPTCTQDGKRHHLCRHCGVIEEESIPAIGHKCVEGTSRRIDKRTMEFFCEHCGETVQVHTTKSKKRIKRIVLSVALLLLLVLGVSAVRHFVLPGYYYLQTKHCAEAGDHEAAYTHYLKLQKLAPHWKKLKNFTVVNTGCTMESTLYKAGKSVGKSYYEDVYEYDKHGNQTFFAFKQNGVSGNFSWRVTYEYEYDTKDRVISRTEYNEDDKPIQKIDYEYNKDGNVTQENRYDPYENLTSFTEYEYDKDGNLVKEYHYYDDFSEPSNKTIYTYDKSNHLTRRTYYDRDTAGRWIKEESLEFDDHGSVTYRAHYYDSEISMEYQYENRYDENGILQKRSTYRIDNNGESELDSKTTYEYDDFLVFYKPKK